MSYAELPEHHQQQLGQSLVEWLLTETQAQNLPSDVLERRFGYRYHMRQLVEKYLHLSLRKRSEPPPEAAFAFLQAYDEKSDHIMLRHATAYYYRTQHQQPPT